MPSSAGTKVNDPNAPAIAEGAGVITSDSLAAESVKNDGSFAAGNPKAGVSSQGSVGTTTNTTDTSGASVLTSASSAEARDAQEEWGEAAKLNAGRGLGKDAGIGPTYNTKPGQGGPVQAGIAPSYVDAGRPDESVQKPHGKNITEGGFDSSAPNASFNNEIGTKNDPGRVAEQKFQRADAQSAHDAAGGPRQAGVTGNTPYDALEETSA